MDFKAFSDGSFDAVNWINGAFDSADAVNSNKETHASNLVYKLQLFVQEINGSLEETAQKVIYNLPKVMKDAEALQDQADELKAVMGKVKNELVSLDKESLAATENIKAIHNLTVKADTHRSVDLPDSH